VHHLTRPVSPHTQDPVITGLSTELICAIEGKPPHVDPLAVYDLGLALHRCLAHTSPKPPLLLLHGAATEALEAPLVLGGVGGLRVVLLAEVVVRAGGWGRPELPQAAGRLAADALVQLDAQVSRPCCVCAACACVAIVERSCYVLSMHHEKPPHAQIITWP
jgi:hypothetical protein